MKKMKKVVLVVAVLIIAIVYSYISKMQMIYDKNIDPSDYLNTGIMGNKVLVQSFICRESSLDGIAIKCQLLGDVSDVELHYSVVNKSENKIISHGKIKANEIQSTKFNIFTFDTVKNCKNKEFELTISSVNATETNGIAFYYQDGVEQNTKMMIDGKTVNGTMIMKTITNRFDIETFCVFLLFVIYVTCFIKFLYKLFK